MTDEPYQNKKIPDHWATSEKTSVVGKMVAVSGVRLYQRGTNLIFPRSRSFPKHSIVEITATDEKEISPGDDVNSVLYLGFFEVSTGGIIVVGEHVSIGDTVIGVVAGFSDVHEPNHINILVCLETEDLRRIMEETSDRSVVKLDIKLNDAIEFGHRNLDETVHKK